MADKASLFLLNTILILVTVLLVFAMKYFSSARQARARIAGDNAYRDLLDKTLKTQEELTASLGSIQSSVAQIENRLAGVEKVLKDVG